MKKLAIFDNDGTLVNTETLMWSVAQKKAFIALGYEPNEELINSFIGKSKKDNLLMLHEFDPNFPSEEFWRIIDLEVKNFIKNEKIAIMPGVIELLEHLKTKGIICSVASSSSLEQINGMMENTGLNKYFDSIFSGANVKVGKPDPEIYLNVLDHYGLKKEEAIIFEDSHYGALAAINAGIDLVLIPNRAIIFDEDKNGAIKVCKQIDEAIDLF